MRNYQTLTIIGAVLTILIALGVYMSMGVLDVFHGSFSNFTHQYSSRDQIQQYERDRANMEATAAQMGGRVAMATVLSIGAIIMVFALSRPTRFLGVALIIIGLIILIVIGWFGILGFALLLAAGIVAMRYKNRTWESAVRDVV
jgi:hypothetical protein